MFTIAGLTWAFLDDPPPAIHLATLDRLNVIWLEDAGDRIFIAEPNVPLVVVHEVEVWLGDHRHEVEEVWVTQVMIPNGWLHIDPWGETQIMVTAYQGTLNVFGVFVGVEELKAKGLAEVLFGDPP